MLYDGAATHPSQGCQSAVVLTGMHCLCRRGPGAAAAGAGKGDPHCARQQRVHHAHAIQQLPAGPPRHPPGPRHRQRAQLGAPLASATGAHIAPSVPVSFHASAPVVTGTLLSLERLLHLIQVQYRCFFLEELTPIQLLSGLSLAPCFAWSALRSCCRCPACPVCPVWWRDKRYF